MATTPAPPPPPPTSPEQRANQLAQRLTDELRDSLNLNIPTKRITVSEETLLADITYEVDGLKSFMAWSKYFHVPVPCISSGEYTIPIISLPLIDFRGYPPIDMPPPFWPDYRLMLEERISWGRDSFKWLSPNDIPDMVFSPLKNFAQVRFEWIKNNPEFHDLGAAALHQAGNPYIPVTVNTNSAGLRIHYSKSFVINFNNVLGSPTSPVKGWLLPGVHKFAGMDAAGNFHYDSGLFTTPPDHVVSLMI
jgi:hypothetical protein